MKGKGRPKGSLGHGKNQGITGTRRDPSLFEYEDTPSATAPPRLEARPNLTQRAQDAEMEIIPEVRVRSPGRRWDFDNNAQVEFTTTQLGLERGAGSNDDLYEPGTLRERAYLRSIAPEKLADKVDNKRLDELQVIPKTLPLHPAPLADEYTDFGSFDDDDDLPPLPEEHLSAPPPPYNPSLVLNL